MYTPLELQQIEFEKKAFGGYNMEDVDKTFSVLKRDYEALYIENATMRKKLKEMEALLSESESIKETLKNVLVTAQKSSEELKATSEKEAELLIKEAEIKGREIVAEAKRELDKLVAEKAELETEIKVFKAKMAALFEGQIKYLEGAE